MSYNYLKLIAGPIERLKNKLAMDNRSVRWFHRKYIGSTMTYKEFLEYINTREETNGIIEEAMGNYGVSD